MTTEKKPAAAKKALAVKKPAAKKPAAKAKKADKPEEVAAVPVTEALPEVTHASVQAAPVFVKDIGSEKFYAVGKRKTAVAQVQVTGGTGKITINELPLERYFGTADLQGIVIQPLTAIGMDKSLTIRGKVHGGGIHAQAEAMRHGIARVLVMIDPEARRTVKKLGFLTRDPRVKERKKPGLRRARRAPQFSKR